MSTTAEGHDVAQRKTAPTDDFYPTSAMWAGVDRLLTDYAELQAIDDVVIAYSPDSRDSAAFVGFACETYGVKVSYVPMRPLQDSGFRARLAEAAPRTASATGKCVLLTFEKDTMSHHGDIRAHFSDRDSDRYRVIRAINAGADLFETGLALGPGELSAFNATLLERLMVASALTIRTQAGTDLRVHLDNRRYQYISNRGVAQPRQFVIIPAGEVATFPASIHGTLVADFAVNVNTIYNDDVRLEASPITTRIVSGQLADFDCPNPDMDRFLRHWFGRRNAKRVGELGFGTNKAVERAVFENSHLNERVPGVHIGFGQHNQTNALAGYECDIHIDLCAKGGLIWFDDDPEPLDLDTIAPSSQAHPAMARDEDVFSEEIQAQDCCGLLSQSRTCGI
ncbi:hypothetical protein [Paraburkholderia caribensis]|uniref:hypothetical protein n=1 Tax=Paraburkholderia caribensis TaxID=75105 RepID=UPI0028646D80|nr:hypothetical protein [Paraburkholderia caribensis]MDR6384026.1 hypothetical protein [Paraburkholderia caribensis]